MAVSKARWNTASARRHRTTTTRTGEWAVAIAATTVVAGTVGLTPIPQASANTSTSVLLSSTASALQPVIDQIQAAMQQAVSNTLALPYASPDDSALLETIVQNNQLELLQILISGVNTGDNQFFNKFPVPSTGSMAETRQAFGFNDPTLQYRSVFIDPEATYRMTGTAGPGTGGLTITSNEFQPGVTQMIDHLNLGTNLNVNPDGSFTIVVGPTEPSDAMNYLDSAEANELLIRYGLSNLALQPGSINIECILDCPAAIPGLTSTGLSDGLIASLLNQLASGSVNFNNQLLGISTGMQQPVNTMGDLVDESHDFTSGNPAAVISAGNFDLEPGQALIVKVPDVGAGYNSIELMNVYGATLPSTFAQTSLNDTQAFHAADGYTYYVISDTNPGVANWLDTSGHELGQMFVRKLNIPADTDADGEHVTTHVVSVEDVRDYLPADTPTVSPEQFAADMNERVLSAGYALHNYQHSDQPSWLTEQLWLHDLKSTMGFENFETVFGSDPFTPMWLRLTPALSPDWVTVVKDLLTNPSGSLTAIQDNWALAQADITEPLKLMTTLLQQEFTQTFQSVQDSLQGGELMQAFQELATGGQQIGAIISDALVDPNISITAGILDARDDLATAIMAANGDFPSELGPLATWQWEHMSDLVQLSSPTALFDLGSLFN